jgi:polyphosphate kinase 2 (PPK2 family)
MCRLADTGPPTVQAVAGVNRQEQRRRLEARRADPLRTCKLRRSTMHRWDDGMPRPGLAGAMFATTHTPVAGWLVVNAHDKRSAPTHAILRVLHALPARLR